MPSHLIDHDVEDRPAAFVDDFLLNLTREPAEVQILNQIIKHCRLQRFRLFGQLPGRNKLKGPGSRLLVSSFPEIKFILSCCGVL
jgi:hypothetical protein